MIRIAIIEDNEAAVSILKDILLEHSKYCTVVITSASIDEHIENEKSINYDVIFLDIELEGNKNGFDYLETVNYTKTPIVIISGHPDKYGLKGYRFKVFEFIPKPFDPNLVLECLKRLNREINTTSSDTKEIKYLFKIGGESYYINKNDLVMIFTLKGKITLLTLGELSVFISKRVFKSNYELNINELITYSQWKLRVKENLYAIHSNLPTDQFLMQGAYIINSKYLFKQTKEEIVLELIVLNQCYRIIISLGNEIKPSYLENIYKLFRIR